MFVSTYISLSVQNLLGSGSALPILVTMLYFFPHVSTALVGLGLLIIEVSRSLSDTPQSVGLLWANDQPDAETST